MQTTSRIDLTQGPAFKTLFRLAAPITISMVMFTVYLLVDLYFVGRLGPDAVAAVSIAGNAFFIHLGFSTILGTGGMVLIAQAFGRKDYDLASKVFKQSILLALMVGSAEALAGWIFARTFIGFFGGSGQALEWGIHYFQIFSISFLCMMLLYVIGNCFRGMGNTKIPMIIMLQANVLNILLDPLLIFGLLGFPELGVRGAALASLISQVYAVGIYAYLILIKGSHVDVKGKWQFSLGIIKKKLYIGIPSGMSHFLLAANLLITYRVVGDYGTAALASLGVGFRILQAIYIPIIAISSAMAAIVGQNYGAGNYDRIAKTFWGAWWLSTAFMIISTLICEWFPVELISIFSNDPEVIFYGRMYLTIAALGNVMVGTIFVISAVFQGLGKTYPSLVGALIDNLLFAALVFTLPSILGWEIQSVWWIKFTTVIIETAFVAVWLRWELQHVRVALEIKPQPA